MSSTLSTTDAWATAKQAASDYIFSTRGPHSLLRPMTVELTRRLLQGETITKTLVHAIGHAMAAQIAATH